MLTFMATHPVLTLMAGVFIGFVLGAWLIAGFCKQEPDYLDLEIERDVFEQENTVLRDTIGDMTSRNAQLVKEVNQLRGMKGLKGLSV